MQPLCDSLMKLMKLNKPKQLALLVVVGVGLILLFIYKNLTLRPKNSLIYRDNHSSTSVPATSTVSTSTERVKHTTSSYNPAHCSKCKNENSTTEALDPANWIPDEPFVYIKFFGGLGNQMFEYACAYTIAKKNKMPLLPYVDPKPGTEDKPRAASFALHLLNIPLPGYDRQKLKIIDEFIDKADNESRIERLSDEDVLSQNYQTKEKILKVSDYSQSELFFLPYRDDIRQFFKPRVLNSSSITTWKSVLKRIDKTFDSVCVHVRRGDFTHTDDRLVNSTFYTMAMDEMRERLQERGTSPVFFMFSDDIKGVEDDFEELLTVEDYEQLQWVSDSETTLVEDLYLMSQCRHNILSGSSFGWWGAYLNDYPEKIVIASHFKPKLFEGSNFASVMYRHFYYPVDWFIREANYVNR